MANVEGVLVSAVPSMYKGTRSSWTPQGGGILFNWDVTVTVNNANYIGQVLSKEEHNYPVAPGTTIVFETDWVEKYGTYKFKGLKDKAKDEAYKKNGGGSGKKFNKAQFIKESAIEIAYIYLEELTNFKEIKVTMSQITNLANVLGEWLTEDGDTFAKKRSYLIACKAMKLNATSDTPIMNNVELTNKAKEIYAYITQDKEVQPVTQQQANPADTGTPATPPPPPPPTQTATPPPPNNGNGSTI